MLDEGILALISRSELQRWLHYILIVAAGTEKGPGDEQVPQPADLIG